MLACWPRQYKRFWEAKLWSRFVFLHCFFRYETRYTDCWCWRLIHTWDAWHHNCTVHHQHPMESGLYHFVQFCSSLVHSQCKILVCTWCFFWAEPSAFAVVWKGLVQSEFSILLASVEASGCAQTKFLCCLLVLLAKLMLVLGEFRCFKSHPSYKTV